MVLAQQTAGVAGQGRRSGVWRGRARHVPVEPRPEPREAGARAPRLATRQLPDGAPIDRPDVGRGPPGGTRDPARRRPQPVIDHVEDEVPVGLVEGHAQLAEEAQEVALVRAPGDRSAHNVQQVPHFQRVRPAWGLPSSAGGRSCRVLQLVEQGQQPVGTVRRLQEVLPSSVVRLVHHQQIPRLGAGSTLARSRRSASWLAASSTSYAVPWVRARWTAQRAGRGRPEPAAVVARHVQGELFVQLSCHWFSTWPGPGSGRADPARDQQLPDHQAGFDGLAQAHLVAEHGPAGNTARCVGARSDVATGRCSGGRAQPGRARQVGASARNWNRMRSACGCRRNSAGRSPLRRRRRCCSKVSCSGACGGRKTSNRSGRRPEYRGRSSRAPVLARAVRN